MATVKHTICYGTFSGGLPDNYRAVLPTLCPMGNSPGEPGQPGLLEERSALQVSGFLNL